MFVHVFSDTVLTLVLMIECLLIYEIKEWYTNASKTFSFVILD